MLGAVFGDIVGSAYEWDNVKTKDFPLITPNTRYTDDSVMTLAVAQWLMEDPEHTEKGLVKTMQRFGRRHYKAGYGGRFKEWIQSKDPQPYNSWGNGSAMRVSPVGLYASSLEEALELARLSASVTHNHPEGIKGAMAVAECVFWNKDRNNGLWSSESTKVMLKNIIQDKYGYDLSRTLNEIRPNYKFDVSCQGSVPEAIIAFLESESLEDCVRNAVSLGGDSDTIAAIACSIFAANKEGWDESLVLPFQKYLTGDLMTTMDCFEELVSPRKPIRNSYRVMDRVYAGEYPIEYDEKRSIERINQFERFGITHYIDLTEDGEHLPYAKMLGNNIQHIRFPIKDMSAPHNIESVKELIAQINEILHENASNKVYIHCWGGVGRTGVIVACLLSKQCGFDYEKTMDVLTLAYSDCPKSTYRETPESNEQRLFIAKYAEEMKHEQLDGCKGTKESVDNKLVESQ
jgi:ADP-ribosylglycohydrolase